MQPHPFWKDFPALQADLGSVSNHIESVVVQSPAAIRNDLSRLLLSRGKMLRPAFVLLASGWGEKERENIPAIAAAVELLHTASLVHDDVLDEAVTRRGIATLHTTMGIKKAVLIGDYLLGISLKLAVSGYDRGAIPLFIERLNSLLESEIDQDFPENNLYITRDLYLKRIRGKTAELFGLSCMAGARISGCDSELCDKLYDLGILFGMAFQIDDDILDYTGASGLLGKGTGKDLKAGITTLPFIEAVLDGDRKAKAFRDSRFRQFFPGRMVRRIVLRGYTGKAAELSSEYKRQALELLKSLPECPAKTLFQEVLNTLQNRAI